MATVKGVEIPGYLWLTSGIFLNDCEDQRLTLHFGYGESHTKQKTSGRKNMLTKVKSLTFSERTTR